MELRAWQSANADYLAASLRWIRLRLTHLALGAPTAGPTIETPPYDLVSELQQAASARDAASRTQPSPALLLLAEQLGLSAFERDVLLLCSAMELDTRVAELCGRAVGDPRAAYPTFALALSMLDAPSWDAITTRRPLRLWKLIDVQLERSQTLTSAPLRADERIVNYIKGINVLDERLSLLMRTEPPQPTVLPASQAAATAALLARWDARAHTEPLPVALLLGHHADAKLLVASSTAAALGRQLCVIGIDALPTGAVEIESLARLWQRESALLPLALYLDTQVDAPSSHASAALDVFVTRAVESQSLVFIGAREPLARSRCELLSLEIGRPSPQEQCDAWCSALTELGEPEGAAVAARLAGQFSLNLLDIERIVRNTPLSPRPTLADRLWDTCRDCNRPRLDRLCQRIEVKATWNDLVLSGDSERQLRELVTQVAQRSQVYQTWGFGARMSRGLGISVLFAGDSGTGKTMAAEVIANHLRLSLYRVDLSQVVSKFIGDTEKNLRELFDSAESGGSILFFDEADALFGKRSEVRDSHDRYANIEVNYLLQRMESHTGLAILATNMRNALDSAFVRRLRFIVPFNFPRPSERRVLWSKAFPDAVPVDGVDVERLAKLSLTGASIQNVALNAAFLAAHAGSAVTMPLLMQAIRSEFQKIERPINEAELRL